jgi:hypothetical protein
LPTACSIRAVVQPSGEEGRPIFGIAPIGNDPADASAAGRLAFGLGIRALVGHHCARCDVTPDVEQGLELATVAGFAAGEVEVERQPLEVALQVDLGTEPATRAAKHLAVLPLFCPSS